MLLEYLTAATVIVFVLAVAMFVACNLPET
jgi:hypothetical protein